MHRMVLKKYALVSLQVINSLYWTIRRICSHEPFCQCEHACSFVYFIFQGNIVNQIHLAKKMAAKPITLKQKVHYDIQVVFWKL